MKTKYFKCSLLSDVVLNAETSTEGSPRCLDYIPGANFLGMVAGQLYEKDGIDSHSVFHSGKVRFCDARISRENVQALKVPASWYFPKGFELEEKETIKDEKDALIKEVNGDVKKFNVTRVHHRIQDREKLTDQGIQLKQARSGYFLPDGELLRVERNYQQKSAYDSVKRRSKDEKMFGYQSIPQGSEFVFRVEFDIDEQDTIDAIEKALVGTKRLGRSRTAQYGLVKIKKIDKSEPKKEEVTPGKNQELIVYAESDLCFFNEFGEATLQPTPSDFGLSSGEIKWDATQIRHRSYAPWNGKRRTREADRVVIEKGSVFVILNAKPESGKDLPSCVGAYRAEGLGQVIYNPSFLEADKEGRLNLNLYNRSEKKENPNSVEKDNHNNKASLHPLYTIKKDEDSDSAISEFLVSRKTKADNRTLVDDAIKAFVEAKKEIFTQSTTASQWGGIRSRAAVATSKEKLKDILLKGVNSKNKKEQTGYLVHGKSQWNKLELEEMDKIFQKNYTFPLPDGNNKKQLPEELFPAFVERLAAQMQKECQNAKKKCHEQ
ncbi:MAG: hypothetical protein ACEPOZ_20055 [Marinifilaceae bacterium]